MEALAIEQARERIEHSVAAPADLRIEQRLLGDDERAEQHGDADQRRGSRTTALVDAIRAASRRAPAASTDPDKKTANLKRAAAVRTGIATQGSSGLCTPPLIPTPIAISVACSNSDAATKRSGRWARPRTLSSSTSGPGASVN